MKKIPYLFYKQIVMRAPTLSSDYLVSGKLDEIIATRDFDNSLSIVSKDFYNHLKQNKINFSNNFGRESKTLYKYINRLSFKPAPFSVISGLSIGEWGTDTKCTLNGKKKYVVNLDYTYLRRILNFLENDDIIKESVRFYPNNTIYQVGSQFRYIEEVYDGEVKKHKLSGVDASPFLKKILSLSKSGRTLASISEELSDENFSNSEITDFLNELKDSSVLISELKLGVHDNIENQIYELLKKNPQLKNRWWFQDLHKLLSISSKVDDIDQILSIQKFSEDLLKRIGLKLIERNVLKIDTFIDFDEFSISTNIQKELIQVLKLLNKISPHRKNNSLEEFKVRFVEKFQDEFLPLSVALDPQHGVGYFDGQERDQITSELLDGLDFPVVRGPGNFSWDPLQEFIFEKYMKAVKTGANSIEIDDKDIDLLLEDWSDIPETIYFVFRMLNRDGKILVESVGGSSSGNLIARFSNSSNAINKIVNDLNFIEKELLSEKIIAEIDYSPNDKVSNILVKPLMREWQTSILGNVNVAKNKIMLSDIFVGVSESRIILYSKSLKKEIVPRITSAHNYRFDKTPIYRFLGDVQNYNYRKYIGFSWGDFLKGRTYLPRVQYKSFILQAARWNLKREDFLNLIHHGKNALNEFLKAFNIPTRIILLDRGDDELFIDFENDLSFLTFLSEIKTKSNISFTEYLFDSKNSYVTDNNLASYTNQILTFLYKEKPVKNLSIVPFVKKKSSKKFVQKQFSIGSEWLFYKIYCSEGATDEILIRVIFPLAKKLLKTEKIDKWFFIRYADPKTHLRVRFHLKNSDDLTYIVNLLNQKITSYLNSGIVRTIQTDIYEREIQRYKPYAIETVEDFFFNDTKICEKILSRLFKSGNEDERWLISLIVLDQTFEGFELTLKERIEMLRKLYDYFFNEHFADKQLRHQLSSMYREKKQIISFELSQYKQNIGQNVQLKELLKEKLELCKIIKTKILENDEDDLGSIQSSLLHMSMNRIFNVKQRSHEFVCYSLLLNYYVSLNAQIANVE
ncbi:lantibiotic dehydratase [Sphingobacterium anhuiense]|uniref:Lantibiotic dehydratase n=1 Tax=Sphingobacterium anhuiense TaxID=493780 RepID=A0ABW5YQ48_9SPHI